MRVSNDILPRFVKWPSGAPPSPTRPRCKFKERYIALLILGTFALICFGTIFFLPDVRESLRGSGLKRVEKHVRGIGEDLLLPAPGGASHGSADLVQDARLARDRRKLYDRVKGAELAPPLVKPRLNGDRPPPDPLHPLISGGEDPDPVMRFRRRKIKEVR